MLGRDFVERCSGEHCVVIANRGVTDPVLFKNLEHVKIDRSVSDGCLALKALGPVDAVVDFSCYAVEHLENTIPSLPQYGRYVYISTMSVFDMDALRQPDPGSAYYWYCVNKIQCEDWIHARKNSRWSIVRPCAVVGKHDYTGRFFEREGVFYWKWNGQPAGNGTVPVEQVSRVICGELRQVGFREINM
jgi:nucleoside-diphosphate-sugar epimerase